MGKLKLDFYESGIGDTILITFPSGCLGVVDAHPAQRGSLRPPIENLVAGKQVRFVCLTHPHADHGEDLIPILKNHPDIAEFWCTFFDVPAFLFGATQTINFPSPVQAFAAKMNQDWGSFLVDIFYEVLRRKIDRRQLNSNSRHCVIDSVEIHCLGPDESVVNGFFDAYNAKLTNPEVEVPDINQLSAILALKFGNRVVLLGADALKKNWHSAAGHFRKRRLPKACILKVPHHGAKNALSLEKKTKNYLELCSSNPKARSVLFAGDSKHPNDEVYQKLSTRTEVFCLSNGRKRNARQQNPLGLMMPGARAVGPAPVCNPVVSFEIDETGNVTVAAGASCGNCPL